MRRPAPGARPVIFLVLLGLVMLLNELPPVRQLGYRMRLGLYAFSLATFTIYLVPLLLGRLGDLVFGASIGLAGCLFMGTVMALGDGSEQSRRERSRLAAPGVVVCLALGALYLGGLIPPVPLSVQAHGLYYDVRKEAGTYTLRTLPPPAYVCWRNDARPFRARSGDSMVYFARVFAPGGFSHRVIIHWEFFDESAGKYTSTDRIPMTVVGGRSLGFRGFAIKSSVQPGRWRVGCETEDGRSISVLTFRVVADAGTGERRFREIRM